MHVCVRPTDVTPRPGDPAVTSHLQNEFLIAVKSKDAVCSGSRRINVFRQIYGPGGSHSPHQHRTTEHAYYVLSGTARVRIGDATFDARPDTVFYVPPQTEHEVHNPGSVPYVTLVISVDLDEQDIEPARARRTSVGGPLCIYPENTKPRQAVTRRIFNLQDEPLLSPRSTDVSFSGTGRLAVLRHTYAVGGKHLPNAHEASEQVYYIAKGHGRVGVAGEMFDAGANAAFYIAPQTMHEITNLGDGPLVNLLINVDL